MQNHGTPPDLWCEKVLDAVSGALRTPPCRDRLEYMVKWVGCVSDEVSGDTVENVRAAMELPSGEGHRQLCGMNEL